MVSVVSFRILEYSVSPRCCEEDVLRRADFILIVSASTRSEVIIPHLREIERIWI